LTDKTIETFSGNSNLYVVLGKRGAERLGISVIYVVHPDNGIGFFLVRFVDTFPMEKTADFLKGECLPFKYFSPRQWGDFKRSDGTDFVALRLNRVGIPVFAPGPAPLNFLTMCDKFMIWDVLTDWLADRLKADGFEPTDPGLDVRAVLRDLVGGTLEGMDDSQIQLVLEFPEIKQQQQADSKGEK
jgi:hypothetical protein